MLRPPEREATTEHPSFTRSALAVIAANMWFLLVAMGSLRAGLALPTPSPAPIPLGAQCLGSACFGLFGISRTFTEAGGVCEAGGGHLMTVRSTVAAEAIALLLLRDRPGSAWLGLRLPGNRCVEPTKRLRGFQWVTGDERTDFDAWESNGSDAKVPTCGPMCVAVTAQLRWQERACNASAEAILCEYNYPNGTCGPLPAAFAVTYLTPFGARESDLVASPPGTTAVVQSLGAVLECRAQGNNGSFEWVSAAPGAWDCQLQNGGCDDQCHLDEEGRPHCACLEGKTLLEDQRSCWSPCASLGCQQYCEPQGDSGVCMCFEGYELDSDGKSCLDIDDCQATPGLCEQECINTQGAFECRCWQGYDLVKGKCLLEKWACFDLTCEHDCNLVDGEYKCTCFEGYIPDPKSPHKCLQVCNQSQCAAQCDPNNINECYCPENFILEMNIDGIQVCTDINECEAKFCGSLKCINIPGSYNCICPNGLIQEAGSFCEEPSEEPEEFSGETETYPKSPVPPSFAPPKDGSSRGTLVAIIVGVTCTVVMLVVIICYLVKKRYAAQSISDYKSQQSESGVALQHVSSTCDSSRQKM
ncbi:thrombomodulin [Pantherophis guttatus]|uniref:Thrombomodulin n=1 Tax=Pantherophis guttatus TaxID=94885 RepID=A0A6P9BI90_PANGU|nr:thrombomodulin [Pantherophis guttatus]